MDIFEKKARFDKAYLKVYQKHQLTRKEALSQFHIVIDTTSNEAVQVKSDCNSSFIKECDMLYRFCFYFE
jgi:hypothetical protein